MKKFLFALLMMSTGMTIAQDDTSEKKELNYFMLKMSTDNNDLTHTNFVKLGEDYHNEIVFHSNLTYLVDRRNKDGNQIFEKRDHPSTSIKVSSIDAKQFKVSIYKGYHHNGTQHEQLVEDKILNYNEKNLVTNDYNGKKLFVHLNKMTQIKKF